MIIEIHSPATQVQEWLIDHVKQKLATLHNTDKEISRAEVFFRKHPTGFNGEYECEIDLTIFGSSIMVQRHANSYAHAAIDVLSELQVQVEEQMNKQRDIPDTLTSTVDI